jgi:hypothetical protein
MGIMTYFKKYNRMGLFSFCAVCLFFGCGTAPFSTENRIPAVSSTEEAAFSPVLPAEEASVPPAPAAGTEQITASTENIAAGTEKIAAGTAGPAAEPVSAVTAGPAAGTEKIAAGPPAAAAAGYARDMARFEEARRELKKFVKSESRQDYASGAVFANFREITLGGIPPQVLYRGSHPALPGDARFPYAQQLAENARVVTVLNLVDTEDGIALRAENIPWYQNFINRKNIAALALPDDFTAPGFFAGLKTALSFMAARNPPYLIHGIDGGERTGFIAALLEALMGASPEEITADYMTSYINLYRIPADGESYRIIARLAEDVLLRICNGKAPERRDLQREAERFILEEIGLRRDELEALKQKLSGSKTVTVTL